MFSLDDHIAIRATLTLGLPDRMTGWWAVTIRNASG